MEKQADRLPFTEKDIKHYLDACIEHWRQERDDRMMNIDRGGGAAEIDAGLKASHYIDAFQSVRTSIFGETLQ